MISLKLISPPPWNELNAEVAAERREKIFLFFPCVPLRTLRSETVLSLCNSVTSVVKSAILFCFTTEVTENTEGIAEGCWEDLNAGVAEVRREKIFLFFPCVPLRTLRSETVLPLCHSVTSVVKSAILFCFTTEVTENTEGIAEGCWEDLNAGVAEVRREKIFLFFPCVPLRTLRSETV